MTTTEEVPMPEPYSHNCTGDQLRCADGHGCECAMAGHGPEPIEYTADQLRAYADAKCAALRAERDALAAKVKGLEADAARYRWLRDKSNFANRHAPAVVSCPLDDDLKRILVDSELDAAIDAAGGDQA